MGSSWAWAYPFVVPTAYAYVIHVDRSRTSFAGRGEERGETRTGSILASCGGFFFLFCSFNPPDNVEGGSFSYNFTLKKVVAE